MKVSIPLQGLVSFGAAYRLVEYDDILSVSIPLQGLVSFGGMYQCYTDRDGVVFQSLSRD